MASRGGRAKSANPASPLSRLRSPRSPKPAPRPKPPLSLAASSAFALGGLALLGAGYWGVARYYGASATPGGKPAAPTFDKLPEEPAVSQAPPIDEALKGQIQQAEQKIEALKSVLSSWQANIQYVYDNAVEKREIYLVEAKVAAETNTYQFARNRDAEVAKAYQISVDRFLASDEYKPYRHVETVKSEYETFIAKIDGEKISGMPITQATLNLANAQKISLEEFYNKLSPDVALLIKTACIPFKNSVDSIRKKLQNRNVSEESYKDLKEYFEALEDCNADIINSSDFKLAELEAKFEELAKLLAGR